MHDTSLHFDEMKRKENALEYILESRGVEKKDMIYIISARDLRLDRIKKKVYTPENNNKLQQTSLFLTT
jgi:hypothetical protein